MAENPVQHVEHIPRLAFTVKLLVLDYSAYQQQQAVVLIPLHRRLHHEDKPRITWMRRDRRMRTSISEGDWDHMRGEGVRESHSGTRIDSPPGRQGNVYGSADSPSNAYSSSSRYSAADGRPVSSPSYGTFSCPYTTGSPYGESRLPESADRGGESRTLYDIRTWPTSAPPWNGAASRRVLPAISDLPSGNRWSETNHHAPIHLAPLNGDPVTPLNHASRGGSGYSDARDLPPPSAEVTTPPADRSTIREDGYVDHQGIASPHSRRHSTEDEPPLKRARLNDETVVVKQSRSISPPQNTLHPRVRRGLANCMGMSGVITTSPDGGLEGLRWWGEFGAWLFCWARVVFRGC
jgi:hypothetical protein